MPEPELASGGAPSSLASGGPSVPWALVELAASGVAGGSDAGGSDAGSLSLDQLRAMKVVSSRLRSVPENGEIDEHIDSRDQPTMDEASQQADLLKAFVDNLKAEGAQEMLALGATACPEGGEVAARNKFRT